jgi:hypothetical protein
MNDWDRDNLHFILSSEDGAFEEWLDQADDDDIAYALELIRLAKAELIKQEHEMLDDVTDLSEAKQVIDKFRVSQKF